MKFAFLSSFVLLFLLSPAFMNGTVYKTERTVLKTVGNSFTSLSKVSASMLYDSLGLEDFGLNEKAFKYAWKGFLQLAQKGKLTNLDYLTIADFSQSSRNKRLYVLDLNEMKVLKNTYVAHGRKSGGEFAQSFSNRPESNKSSLGFYVTGTTYFGQHGLSLNINGIEKGINDKARARRIVIHGADYIGENFLENNPFTGRSYGCPAIPSSDRDEVINTIKEGSCLFIYHPSKTYLTTSKILKS
jgi:hypothetical protein